MVAPDETAVLMAMSLEAEDLARRLGEVRARIAERLDVAEREKLEAAANRRALKVRPRRVTKSEPAQESEDDDLV